MVSWAENESREEKSGKGRERERGKGKRGTYTPFGQTGSEDVR